MQVDQSDGVRAEFAKHGQWMRNHEAWMSEGNAALTSLDEQRSTPSRRPALMPAQLNPQAEQRLAVMPVQRHPQADQQLQQQTQRHDEQPLTLRQRLAMVPVQRHQQQEPEQQPGQPLTLRQRLAMVPVQRHQQQQPEQQPGQPPLLSSTQRQRPSMMPGQERRLHQRTDQRSSSLRPVAEDDIHAEYIRRWIGEGRAERRFGREEELLEYDDVDWSPVDPWSETFSEQEIAQL